MRPSVSENADRVYWIWDLLSDYYTHYWISALFFQIIGSRLYSFRLLHTYILSEDADRVYWIWDLLVQGLLDLGFILSDYCTHTSYLRMWTGFTGSGLYSYRLLHTYILSEDVDRVYWIWALLMRLQQDHNNGKINESDVINTQNNCQQVYTTSHNLITVYHHAVIITRVFLCFLY